MKPSELTPLTALVLCDLAKEAGIPAGVINTVPGLGATTGDAISRHMDIDKVSEATRLDEFLRVRFVDISTLPRPNSSDLTRQVAYFTHNS